jgi:GntR family transcriptional regulator
MAVVDSHFPGLLRNLRHDRGLSLRDLARIVHYSHSYVWDLETGRKQPTPEIAAALDTALAAGGALTDLVADDTNLVDCTPLTEAITMLEANRHQLEEIARRGWSAAGGPEAHVTAQCAQLASWLYNAFVRSRPPLARLGAQRYSRRIRQETGASPFRMEVLRQGRTPRGECRSITQQAAPPEVASRLMIGPADVVIRRENCYYVDNEPIQLGVTYIPASVAGISPAVRTHALGRGSLYARLEELGYQIARIRECVLTRLPTPDEAASLRMPPGVPVLEILHTSYDHQNQPFEVTRFTMRADLTVIDYEMPVED